ncbi:2-dehydro-3-deoxygluconokinase [Gemmobacter tilapiae]|uniref:2-dehydro-3-deoxygluconokinase n=1 Tax=Neogemmobacter tilapiae TaxID=875041 RepID=A0A918TP20_9RHOB|nr:2-dehydro-3-deoxygluconokinase [Gemmobacter tilapiae]
MSIDLKAKRVLAIGECMVEMAPQAGALYKMGFAGDTFNTTWYLRRCLPADWSVGYLTAVGQDGVSDRMIGFMADSGIDTSAVIRRPDRTVGLYMIQLSDKGERSFAYWRNQSAARLLADDEAQLIQRLSGVGLAYFSGITLAILDVQGRARLFAALAAARAAGTKVAFDPNLRPALWSDSNMMCETIMQAAAQSDIVLPSFDDEARWFGDTDPAATLARYAQAEEVVVKNGEGAMRVRSSGHVFDFQPPAVAQVVDSTAAGDSFNAAYLAARLAGTGVPTALQAGAALAGRVIGARGALVEMS